MFRVPHGLALPPIEERCQSAGAPLGICTSAPSHLATAIHIVKLVSHVVVLAFTAIDLVSLFGDRESSYAGRDRVNKIVAIPAVDDILTRAAGQRLVVAVAPVEHVIAPIKVGQIVLPGPPWSTSLLLSSLVCQYEPPSSKSLPSPP